MLVTDGGQPAKFAEILEWGYHLAKTPRELPTVASTDS